MRHLPQSEFEIHSAVVERSTDDWRQWWREQSKRDGTDWQSLGLIAARALWKVSLTSSAIWRSS